ncbi:MAG: nucleotide exchange factor GrpE [Gemmatimonadota bacterium]|nr:nucleotide exchange factor GrpE [Gemmatimonadota bacterium]
MNPPEYDPADQTGEAAGPDPRHASAADGEGGEVSSEDGVGAGSAADSESGEGDSAKAGKPPADGDGAVRIAEDPEGLRIERDQARDRHLRLAADFDNYRKRTEDRLRQRWDRAQADLVSRMLEPLDDLLRVTALEPESASVEAIVEGVDLVERKFFRVLEEAGIEIVDPAGEAFDPNTMEAMMRVPAGSEEDDDIVERVFQRGYTFKGLLVRPARVSVYKA